MGSEQRLKRLLQAVDRLVAEQRRTKPAELRALWVAYQALRSAREQPEMRAAPDAARFVDELLDLLWTKLQGPTLDPLRELREASHAATMRRAAGVRSAAFEVARVRAIAEWRQAQARGERVTKRTFAQRFAADLGFVSAATVRRWLRAVEIERFERKRRGRRE